MKRPVYSLIPAKGKSSQIKNKNLLKIYGRSLLEIAIKSSINSNVIDKTFVSSESKKILNIAKYYNCNLIKRPKILSSKKALGINVIKHFLKSIEVIAKKKNPIIVILQTTSPLRSINNIKNSVKLFKKKKLKYLMSVRKNETSPYKDMIIKNSKLISITSKKNVIMNRQSFPQTYKPNGAIFILSYKNFIKDKSFLNKCHPFIMNKINSLDVDSLNDFNLAKKYFKRVHAKKI